ncbi:MAG TPA: c-type cytochrome [Gemmatimonadales bacterium]|nr:c-type cytochrome [Gemmatimonadales bacterium]
MPHRSSPATPGAPPGRAGLRAGPGRLRLAAAALTLLVPAGPLGAQHPARGPDQSGEGIYRAACAACHGAAGSGAPAEQVGFAVPLPDFTDCNFATREQTADWAAIVRDGGPVRGFSRIMPAFRDALSPEEIRRVLAYLRTFCGSGSWPRGEFNLPRTQFTEKAFPEDETILTSRVATQGPGTVDNTLIYEKRFGARAQLEVALPFSVLQRGPGGAWTAGIGDLALGPKYALLHSLAAGTIVSLGGEVALPTGDTTKGLGTGTTVFEGYLLLGQLLPAGSWFQFQGGVGLPADRARAPRELFWRGALGKDLSFGAISRLFAPIVEVLGTHEFGNGGASGSTDWNLVPQFQLTLSARQHVRLNLGVDVPLTGTDERHPALVAYLLWDWFDGALLEGWKGWCPGCAH